MLYIKEFDDKRMICSIDKVNTLSVTITVISILARINYALKLQEKVKRFRKELSTDLIYNVGNIAGKSSQDRPERNDDVVCLENYTYTMEKLKFAIAKADCSIDDNYIHNFSQYYGEGNRSVEGDVDVEMKKVEEEDAEKEQELEEKEEDEKAKRDGGNKLESKEDEKRGADQKKRRMLRMSKARGRF